MDFFNQIAGTVQSAVQSNQQQGGQQQQMQNTAGTTQQAGGAGGLHLPKEILQVIDKYVDSFAPGISHGVSSEILAFEAATIGSLEQHVKEVIVGIFHGDSTQFQSSQNINEFKAARVGANQAGPDGPNLPQYQYPSTDIVVSRDGTNAQGATADLPAYGTRGLPFAGGTSAAAASTPPPDPAEPERQKSIFQSALSSVSHFAKEATDTVQDGVENEVKSMANKIDELAGDIDQKVEQIIPDLKAKVEEVFQELDKGLADLMTTAALACVKTFLAGAIKVEELGEDVLKGAESLMGGILGHNDAPQTTPGEPHGPVALLSNKLGGGLTVIRGNARVDFRGFLSKIEEDLFNGLPDRLKEPLSKIFGNSSSTTGGGTGILAEIGQKIEQILERIGQALRDRILEVTSGGHRRLEDQAWGNVQDTIVGKVQTYVPGVQVKLQDDPTQ